MSPRPPVPVTALLLETSLDVCMLCKNRKCERNSSLPNQPSPQGERQWPSRSSTRGGAAGMAGEQGQGTRPVPTGAREPPWHACFPAPLRGFGDRRGDNVTPVTSSCPPIMLLVQREKRPRGLGAASPVLDRAPAGARRNLEESKKSLDMRNMWIHNWIHDCVYT